MIALVLTTLCPIILLIALGVVIKARAFVADSFWPGAERIGYYILLPSLFFYSLSTANLSQVPINDMAWVLLASTLGSAALLYAFRGRMAEQGAAFTSVFQGGIRFNNFIGVTVAAGLFGSSGVAMAAVANAIIVPTVNILCVLVFARCTPTHQALGSVLRSLFTNPLLVSCLLGVLARISGLTLPAWLSPMLASLGSAALPMGLLCVGAALSLGSLRLHLRPIACASVIKFLVMPTAAYLLCRSAGFGGQAAAVAVIFQALPTASSSYVMARQMGGDALLMANIIAAQTVAAAVILPVAMGLALTL
ncbi:AEC family transporter [Pseudomonas syringae]|nr:AEC family transporter [Pseudomonas syringae]MBD8790343.1 AEC family transporter [Pseudomonas syringae]MBD8799159.1 AEC family transporter [Pseudomonas syringae]MBD8809985.1 AEC family transporter [Pseudomonas syringae]